MVELALIMTLFWVMGAVPVGILGWALMGVQAFIRSANR